MKRSPMVFGRLRESDTADMYAATCDFELFPVGKGNEWNRLSADCVGASNVNMFKNKIDIYLRRAGYI